MKVGDIIRVKDVRGLHGFEGHERYTVWLGRGSVVIVMGQFNRRSSPTIRRAFLVFCPVNGFGKMLLWDDALDVEFL